MLIDFKCSSGQSAKDFWEGQVQLLATTMPYEMKVTARGSCLTVLCGKYSYGNFLCIPADGVASELAALNDTFWNLERLMFNHPTFSQVDAISIIQALKAISPYVNL